MFDIYTNADNYDFSWFCHYSKKSSNPKRTTRRQAFNDAVAHAKMMLRHLRKTEGTDAWPEHYTAADFMVDCMDMTATCDAVFNLNAWNKANRD